MTSCRIPDALLLFHTLPLFFLLSGDPSLFIRLFLLFLLDSEEVCDLSQRSAPPLGSLPRSVPQSLRVR